MKGKRLEVLNPSGNPRLLDLLRLFRSMVVDSQPEKEERTLKLDINSEHAV